jgi:hypothetical protein
MFKVARVSYFLTVAVCAVISVVNAIQLLASLAEPESPFTSHWRFYTAAVIALFLFPSAKAIVRMVRRAPLLPRPREPSTRAYLILITVTGVLGHIAATLLASAYVDIRVNDLSDVSGIGAAIIVAAGLYLFTLWVGELVVATSGGRADPSGKPFEPS